MLHLLSGVPGRGKRPEGHLERSLRLTRASAEWHELEKRTLAEGWAPSRYLLTLCNEELQWSESEKMRCSEKEAQLPVSAVELTTRYTGEPGGTLELMSAIFGRSSLNHFCPQMGYTSKFEQRCLCNFDIQK